MDNITIVAEAGISHNGDVEIAKELVIKAKECGADAIKFQLFTKEARPAGTKFILQPGLWHLVTKFAKEHGIVCFFSVFDFESVKLAITVEAPWVKLSMIERRNLQLIQECERWGFERRIVSVDLWGQYPKRDGWEYMYCPNNGWSGYYPTLGKHIEWERYAGIAKKTGMGYSCHAQDLAQCVTAVALGAKIIEKHFCLDEDAPDADVSLLPHQFKTMVDIIRGL